MSGTAESEDSVEGLSRSYAAALATIDRLRASNARLIEALRQFSMCPGAFADAKNHNSTGCRFCHAARVLREETKP